MIREAATSDRGAVLRIAAAGMREFGLETDFAGLDRELGSIGERREDAIAALVAVVDQTVCGSVVVSAKSDGVGKLSGFYVGEGYRGHGIGRALLQAAVDEARRAGMDLPTSRGADRSYWLVLHAFNQA